MSHHGDGSEYPSETPPSAPSLVLRMVVSRARFQLRSMQIGIGECVGPPRMIVPRSSFWWRRRSMHIGIGGCVWSPRVSFQWRSMQIGIGEFAGPPRSFRWRSMHIGIGGCVWSPRMIAPRASFQWRSMHVGIGGGVGPPTSVIRTYSTVHLWAAIHVTHGCATYR